MEVDVELGFAHEQAPYGWIPATIDIAAAETALTGQFTIELAYYDPHTHGLRRGEHSVALDIPAFSKHRLQLALPYFADERHPVEMRIEQDGRRIWHSQQTLASVRRRGRVLVIGHAATGFGYLAAGAAALDVLYLRPEHLPTASIVYDGFQLVILDDVSAADIGAEQGQALLDWLELGNRVVMTTHESPGESAFSRRLFGTADFERVSLTVGGGDSGVFRSMARQASLELWVQQPFFGEVLLEEQGYPLVTATQIGGGELVRIGFDPAAAQLAAWDERETMLRTLVPDAKPFAPKDHGLFDDLAAQMLRTQAYQIPPRATLLPLVLLMLAGPLGLFLLQQRRRLARPMIVLVLAAGCSVGLLWANALGSRLMADNSGIGEFVVVSKLPHVSYARVESYYTQISPQGASQVLEWQEHAGGMTALSSRSDSRLLAPEIHYDPRHSQQVYIPATGEWSATAWRSLAHQRIPLLVHTRRQHDTWRIHLSNGSAWDIKRGYVLIDNRWYEIRGLESGAERTYLIKPPVGGSQRRPWPVWMAPGTLSTVEQAQRALENRVLDRLADRLHPAAAAPNRSDSESVESLESVGFLLAVVSGSSLTQNEAGPLHGVVMIPLLTAAGS